MLYPSKVSLIIDGENGPNNSFSGNSNSDNNNNSFGHRGEWEVGGNVLGVNSDTRIDKGERTDKLFRDGRSRIVDGSELFEYINLKYGKERKGEGG